MVAPSDVTWIIDSGAWAFFGALRKEMGEQAYIAQKKSFQSFLCLYFSTGQCLGKQGVAISPMAGAPAGGKGLKVRWSVPGRGKSSSLRIGIVAFCRARTVHIVHGSFRKNDPSPDEFRQAFALAPERGKVS